ncbi:serine/threonine-protein kinase [Streptacidiphilus fuscans]|uniref:non-specific serine/threonine protein kinase n=1 Tax=Streptacidiphilus fuscans TaxID=2789292 RepID=A0A931BBK1_9ACTN|nr:serine/threonine-protein kinase [Streptacidiphilus fuscans]MBF9072237.1 protein kinase [Streptacidiphilus fuscans]
MPENVINDRYELIAALDHGGMGDVWRGYDVVLDRPVAIKRIRSGVVGGPREAEEFAKRFRREARITAKIQHPGVPQVYDAVLGDDHERVFLVMELVEGASLARYIHPERPLPLSWAVAVAAQITTVLSYAHEIPVVHRDLKPSNVMVATDGTVKVLDFGIASLLRTDVTKLTATGSALGSHPYMAPEQVLDRQISPRTDLYALGCVLHELLCGRQVFQGESEFAVMQQQISAPPTPLRELRAEVPAGLEALVLELLRKAPEARPADTQEVYARLLPFLPLTGSAPAPQEAGPSGVPDPTGLYRSPYAPRPRPEAAPTEGQPPAPVVPIPEPESDALRQAVKEADEQALALAEEERYAQAVDVLTQAIERAVPALGSDNRLVLALRRRRAAIRWMADDLRAALPEFEELVVAYARTVGPTAKVTRECRAQAARCRAGLGHVTQASYELQDVLDLVTAVDSHVSEEAIDLRHSVAVLTLAQGRVREAVRQLEPLYADLVMVYGEEHELTQEVAETLFRIGLDPDAPDLD